MPKQSTFTLDEHGRQWLVLPGDPAWQVCNTLLQTMDFIVLPRHTILTGEVRGEDRPDEELMMTELVQLKEAMEWDTDSPPTAIRSLFIRKLRFAQCMDLLTRATLSKTPKVPKMPKNGGSAGG